MHRRHFLTLGSLIAMAAARGATSTSTSSGTGPMLMRRIPSSGELLPAIGLGTSGPFEAGRGEAARAPLREVLQGFFDGGATLIDTSPMYSTAEEVLGDLLTP